MHNQSTWRSGVCFHVYTIANLFEEDNTCVFDADQSVCGGDCRTFVGMVRVAIRARLKGGERVCFSLRSIK